MTEEVKNMEQVAGEVVHFAAEAPPAPKPMPPQMQIMMMIDKAAFTPTVDIEKMKALLDMQERILDRAAREEFSADFSRMQPELPLVIRRKKNDQTKSQYAPLEDINAAITDKLRQHGFSLQSKVLSQTDQGVTVRSELIHRAGHREATDIFMPLDDKGIQGNRNKTAPHAISSSIMYGRRIGICALLNISTGDDKDGNMPKEKPQGDKFSARVEAQAGAPEISLADQAQEQADKLATALRNKKTKADRGKLLMKNGKLLKQLTDLGLEATVQSLHNIVDGGEDDAAAA